MGHPAWRLVLRSPARMNTVRPAFSERPFHVATFRNIAAYKRLNFGCRKSKTPLATASGVLGISA